VITLRHLLPWAFTTSGTPDCSIVLPLHAYFPTELCLLVEDSIRKLRDGPYDNYVPAFKWDIVQEHMGLSPLFAHLVSAAAIKDGEADDTASPAAIVRKLLDISTDDFSIEVPLTAYGLDSLSAARLSHALRLVVPITQMQLIADMTFKDIQAKIANLEDSKPEQASAAADSATDPSVSSSAASVELMQELLDRYSARLPHVSRTIQFEDSVDSGASGMVVLITGTTGAVGCAAMTQLARSPDVAKIYALNRSSPAGESIVQRQRTAVMTQGWDMGEAEWKKVQLLEGDFHRNQLGLASDIYNEVHMAVNLAKCLLTIYFLDHRLYNTHHPLRCIPCLHYDDVS
jgi:acyl carrier protein